MNAFDTSGPSRILQTKEGKRDFVYPKVRNRNMPPIVLPGSIPNLPPKLMERKRESQ